MAYFQHISFILGLFLSFLLQVLLLLLCLKTHIIRDSLATSIDLRIKLLCNTRIRAPKYCQKYMHNICYDFEYQIIFLGNFMSKFVLKDVLNDLI